MSDGDLRRADRVGVRRELTLIYGVAAVALIVVSIGALLASRSVARAQALRDAERMTVRLADLVVGPNLEGALNGDAEQRAELDRDIANRMADGYLTEITVWDKDGLVLYSDEADEIGDDEAVVRLQEWRDKKEIVLVGAEAVQQDERIAAAALEIRHREAVRKIDRARHDAGAPAFGVECDRQGELRKDVADRRADEDDGEEQGDERADRTHRGIVAGAPVRHQAKATPKPAKRHGRGTRVSFRR